MASEVLVAARRTQPITGGFFGNDFIEVLEARVAAIFATRWQTSGIAPSRATHIANTNGKPVSFNHCSPRSHDSQKIMRIEIHRSIADNENRIRFARRDRVKNPKLHSFRTHAITFSQENLRERSTRFGDPSSSARVRTSLGCFRNSNRTLRTGPRQAMQASEDYRQDALPRKNSTDGISATSNSPAANRSAKTAWQIQHQLRVWQLLQPTHK